MIPEPLFQILRSSESNKDTHFPPTEVFGETWMLRLILDAVQRFGISNELRFMPQARWHSDARLDTCFRRRVKRDLLGEGPTRADGVIGHFDFREETKAGLRLTSGSRQFVVVEAKMFSNLSPGTKYALTYDQAARSVACMADTLARSKVRAHDLESVGFFVIAPHPDKRRNRNTNLESCTSALSIRAAVDNRIREYERQSRPEATELRRWEDQYFHPFVERLCNENRLKVLCWDDSLEAITNADPSYGAELNQFYRRCLSFEPSYSRA
jgi:hypothetical protein